MKAELYIQCRCINGEGPVWDAAHQCLRFIDVFGNCIHTWEMAGCPPWMWEKTSAARYPGQAGAWWRDC